MVISSYSTKTKTKTNNKQQTTNNKNKTKEIANYDTLEEREDDQEQTEFSHQEKEDMRSIDLEEEERDLEDSILQQKGQELLKNSQKLKDFINFQKREESNVQLYSAEESSSMEADLNSPITPSQTSPVQVRSRAGNTLDVSRMNIRISRAIPLEESEQEDCESSPFERVLPLNHVQTRVPTDSPQSRFESDADYEAEDEKEDENFSKMASLQGNASPDADRKVQSQKKKYFFLQLTSMIFASFT